MEREREKGVTKRQRNREREKKKEWREIKKDKMRKVEGKIETECEK